MEQIQAVEKAERKWWNPFHLLRSMYDWVLHWADTPYAVPALCILAFAESSFFPIPYKIFTIASGVFWRNSFMDFVSFMGASAIGRSFRFFMVSGIIWYFGPTIKGFIERYFELLTVAFTVALILGFVAVKYLF